MLMGTVGMMAGGGGARRRKKAEMNEDRKDYLRYLGQMRERAREATNEQRAAREWVHPDPQALWSMATSRRMWERRPTDPDFMHLRVGRGSQRLDTRLVPPQTGPVDELEPIATLALRRFVRAHSIVPDLPDLDRPARLRRRRPAGRQGPHRGLARADDRPDGHLPHPGRPADRRRHARAGPRTSGSGRSGCRTPSTPPWSTASARCG